MKRCRCLDPEGRLSLGEVEGEQVHALAGDLLGEVRRTGVWWDLADVRLLAPVMPSKIVAVGRNYRKHAAELSNEVPAVPLLFLKPFTSVIGPGEAIALPPQSQRVDHEGELAVVIGRRLDFNNQADPMAAVAGYTVLNDVTARDLQKTDGQFTRGKGFDTFCPLGPWIETDLDPSALAIRVWVDDELRQEGNTADMVFDVPTLLTFIAGIMTLHPGDVVATGTPAGVGPLHKGQRVRVEVEGIGLLENPVEQRGDCA